MNIFIIHIIKVISLPLRLGLVPLYYLGLVISKFINLKFQFKSTYSKTFCVGNYVLGGTGKTVVVKKIAEEFINLNKKLVIISRGYKRYINRKQEIEVTPGFRYKIISRGKEEEPIILYPEKVYKETIVKYTGDEPFMLFRTLKVPIIISSDKKRALKVALKKFSPEIIIFDDGYQNFSFYKDVNILVINMLDAFGGGWLFPVGRLREPVPGSVRRADYVILNHTNLVSSEIISKVKNKVLYYKPDTKIIQTYYKIVNFVQVKNNIVYQPEKFLVQNSTIILFTGVAQPKIVELMLKNAGIKIVKHYIYKDHYWYQERDLKKFSRHRLPVLTTEKDMVRILPLIHKIKDDVVENLYYVKIELTVNEGENIWQEMVKIV